MPITSGITRLRNADKQRSIGGFLISSCGGNPPSCIRIINNSWIKWLGCGEPPPVRERGREVGTALPILNPDKRVEHRDEIAGSDRALCVGRDTSGVPIVRNRKKVCLRGRRWRNAGGIK